MEKQFTHYKKNVSILMLICILTAFLFSVIFIDLHASHECTGHFCTTCENLDFACKVIKQMGMSFKLTNVMPLIGIVLFMYIAPFTYSFKKHITLVNLKVRLDD